MFRSCAGSDFYIADPACVRKVCLFPGSAGPAEQRQSPPWLAQIGPSSQELTLARRVAAGPAVEAARPVAARSGAAARSAVALIE